MNSVDCEHEDSTRDVSDPINEPSFNNTSPSDTPWLLPLQLSEETVLSVTYARLLWSGDGTLENGPVSGVVTEEHGECCESTVYK